MKAAHAELVDLERRLDRQLLNLEADDTTPALRRRIGVRVAGLEDAITERVQRIDALTAQAAAEAPTLADVTPLLELLPKCSQPASMRCPSANYGRCSTSSTSKSATSPATTPSMSRSPSATNPAMIKPGTVKARLSRGRAALAAALGDDAGSAQEAAT